MSSGHTNGFFIIKTQKEISQSLSKLLLFLFYNKGRCAICMSHLRKEGFQHFVGVISNCWCQIKSVPLNIKVGIEEAALPQPCDLFRFLLCGISRHCGEHHHSPALLGQFQQFFRFRGIHFGEVNGRRSPLVLRKVPFLNVIILLWDSASADSATKSNDLQCLC